MKPKYKPVGRREREEFKRAGLEWVLGGKCAHCGTTKDLQFDHIDPAKPAAAKSGIWRQPWDRIFADLFNLQMLCPSCHIEKTSREA